MALRVRAAQTETRKGGRRAWSIPAGTRLKGSSSVPLADRARLLRRRARGQLVGRRGLHFLSFAAADDLSTPRETAVARNCGWDGAHRDASDAVGVCGRRADLRRESRGADAIATPRQAHGQSDGSALAAVCPAAPGRERLVEAMATWRHVAVAQPKRSAGNSGLKPKCAKSKCKWCQPQAERCCATWQVAPRGIHWSTRRNATSARRRRPRGCPRARTLLARRARAGSSCTQTSCLT